MLSHDQKRELVLKLVQIGAIKLGNFALKSGVTSPIYMDLRLFVSYPRFLKQVIEIYADIVTTLTYDRLAGIPYAALPITAALALEVNEPWIFPRKELKQHGTKKLIEGKYEKGDRIVVIDDVITKGDSKIESLEPFKKAGLVVTDFVVLIDYEKGGSALLKSKGYGVHTAITMNEIAVILLENKIITERVYKNVLKFLASS